MIGLISLQVWPTAVHLGLPRGVRAIVAAIRMWKQGCKEKGLGWAISPVGWLVFFSCSVFFLVFVSISGYAHPAEPAAAVETSFLYTGTTPCAFSDCHGSVTATDNPDSPIDQNEYYTWLKRDRHAKAYEVLQKARSAHILKNLKIAENAEAHPRCLACHAVNVPADQRGKYFQIAEGVSCESCHGPAKQWLGPHRRQGQGYEAALELGMYDTKNLRKRAEKCLSCHLGDEQRNVDHALIAAGHPDLLFELDTFSALMPPHWRESQKEAWLGARQWAIGQAVALREAAKQLARRAGTSPVWPEFAEFECFACHHTIQGTASAYYQPGQEGLLEPGAGWAPSWRQARGYQGRAGAPPWNASRSVVFRHFVRAALPDAAPALDKELAFLAEQLQLLTAADPKTIAASATQLARLVDQLLTQVEQTELTLPLVMTVLKNIVADQRLIALAGVRGAEQVVMAVDALFLAYTKNSGAQESTTAPIRTAIQNLFRIVEQPQTYTAQAFSAQLQTIQATLAKL